jgi:hypothetical protein
MIRVFLGLLDPDPLVRCTAPEPAPDSFIKQKIVPVSKTLIPTVCDFFLTFYLLKMIETYI